MIAFYRTSFRPKSKKSHSIFTSYIKILPILSIAISGCAVEQDRTGYADAWYYERLRPYYTNDLAFTPRVHLRAVREIVGIPIVLEDGSEGHADVFRHDIELFFAAPVTVEEERIDLIQSAVRITCPQTDLTEIQDKIVYFDETYVVLQKIACLGHATE